MQETRPWVAWILVGLIAPIIAVAFFYGRARPMSIDVLRMDDPGHIGMITRMTLQVRNNGPADATPIFTVLSSFPFPVRWGIASGPGHLPSGATAIYTVESPADGAIAPDDEAVVRVNDIRSHVFGASRPVRASLRDTLVLVNPAFREWTIDVATGQSSPLGWTAEGLRSPLGTNLRIAHEILAGREAIVFLLGSPTQTWEGIRVNQYVQDSGRVARLFGGGFTASVYPTFTSTPGYGPRSIGNPGSMFAIQIYADGRWLWLMFSDGPTGWRAERDAAVLVVHSPLNQWSSHRIDLRALYHRLGWSVPREVFFTLLAGRTGGTSGSPGPAFGTFFLGPPATSSGGRR